MEAKVLSSWVIAEFDTPERLVEATRTMRERGFADLDTYSPFPLHGGSEALGLRRSRIPFIAGCGTITGVVTAFVMQTYMNTVDYPLNVGGRPLLSLPAMVPVIFELGVLLTAFSIFFGLLALSRLPQPYHPVFESEAFRSASTHGYWLSIGHPTGSDPAQVTGQLTALGAANVAVVTGEPV